MGDSKKPLPKESEIQKAPIKRLKKAIPPPDNPLLRFQAEEAAREGESVDEEQMARLRFEALEKTKRMPTADVTDTTDDKPSFDDQG